MKRVHKSSRNNQKGAVAVEFVVMLPFLVLLLCGIVDFGLLIREHQLLGNAAREGARFSSLPRNQILLAGDATQQAAVLAGIEDRVKAYLQQETNSIPPGSVTVVVSQTETVNLGNGTSISASKVNVSYSHPLLLANGRLGPATVRATAIFPNLY
jgi:Flp pilus assembly protein TadG